jgi:adenine-specific DNA-methyltransferase
MEKLKMHSPDLVESNLDKLAELFPGCVTEAHDDKTGLVTRAVDFDRLRQELAGQVVEGPRERYQLDWPGKRKATILANEPIAMTLRPMRSQSVEFDTTKNVFIEGDNLDSLKLLQETYLGKVDFIYIDPPYNTGSDLLYVDSFSHTESEFDEISGVRDDSGRRLVSNTRSNGRFHSAWLSMMFPRLRIARNLLSERGLIYVSIDDHEVGSLRLVLDEVFGEANFVEHYVWESNFRPDNSSRLERENAQHILCYARKKSDVRALVGVQKKTEGLPSLTKSSMAPTSLAFKKEWIDCQLPDGTYMAGDKGGGYSLLNDVVVENGIVCNDFGLTGRMIWSQKYLDEQVSAGTRIVIKGPSFVPYSKKLETSALAPTSLIPNDVCGDVLAGNAEIMALFGAPVFNHPKPLTLLRYLCSNATHDKPDALILDFFAGSASTAHAVMKLNAEDGGNRRFIMVQIPQQCKEDSAAFKSGYVNIAEIAKERIRRAGTALLTTSLNPSWRRDIGFRVLKVDTWNREDTHRSADCTEQSELALSIESVRSERSPDDLLFGVLVDWGVDLSLPIERKQISGKSVFLVDTNALAACFDDGIDEALVRELAMLRPLRAVFRDGGYASDSTKINVEQIFKLLSPATDVRSL